MRKTENPPVRKLSCRQMELDCHHVAAGGHHRLSYPAVGFIRCATEESLREIPVSSTAQDNNIHELIFAI